MAPKRKVAAGKSKPRKKAAAKKKTVKPTYEPSPLALAFIYNFRFPRDIWYQIIEESDVITQTVLGITCKTFREIYLKVVEKRGLDGILPVPVIDLSHEILFPDGTLITLRSCLANWAGCQGGIKRVWNPWLEKWCNSARMAVFVEEGGLVEQYGQELIEEIEGEKEARHEERQRLKGERQEKRERENQDRQEAREAKAQKKKDHDYYREDVEGYDHDFDADDDESEGISSDESVESGEEIETDEEVFWGSDSEDAMGGDISD
ncbi:uncharacterized protein PAC_05952 [Phialocephala subalpina]|uniref:Uncharacterized protein n=1 Tax=Phialocephala subalpina TaxID=576137 RepID=A0A1L7WTF4_9HELO|nr:uncharacterized protein PAC_05952 [Phialocephala subalpina]